MTTLTKNQLLTELNIKSLDNLTYEQVQYLHSKYKKRKKVVKKLNIDVTTDLYKNKYAVALKYVNGLLKNMGKKSINNLNMFIDIDRLDIISDRNRDLLKSGEKELYGPFEGYLSQVLCRFQ